jgi:hypothetical protein
MLGNTVLSAVVQCCQPSRPSAISAGRQVGRHRAVTINTYTVTLECAVQDIDRLIYISRLSISSKHSGLDGADVEGSCFSQDSGEMYLLQQNIYYV